MAKGKTFAIALALSLSMLSSRVLAECGPCAAAQAEAAKAEKSIRRLGAIIQSNQDYIAGLDPRDTSELLKATSNISIARKRAASLEASLKEHHQTMDGPDCGKCLSGGKQDG
jgi:hypothetical protein